MAEFRNFKNGIGFVLIILGFIYPCKYLLTHRDSRRMTRDKMPIWSSLLSDICWGYRRSWYLWGHTILDRSWPGDAGNGVHDNQSVEHLGIAKRIPRQPKTKCWKTHEGHTRESPTGSKSCTDQSGFCNRS